MLKDDFDGPPSLYFDPSETGESTKCPWVRVFRQHGEKGWQENSMNHCQN